MNKREDRVVHPSIFPMELDGWTNKRDERDPRDKRDKRDVSDNDR